MHGYSNLRLDHTATVLMASQSNQGGGGPATPPDQTVPTAASAEDFTRYVSLATDVLRATAGQRLLERCAAAVEGDAAALDQVWKELKPGWRKVAAEIKAHDPPLADRVELMASHADEFMRLIKVRSSPNWTGSQRTRPSAGFLPSSQSRRTSLPSRGWRSRTSW